MSINVNSERWRQLRATVTSSRGALVVLLGIAVLLPMGLSNHYYLHITVQAMIYAILALGLNVIVSCGLLNLGYIAFFAIGAYCYAILSTVFGASFWVVLPLALLLCSVIGIVLAFVSLRSRGDYFALLTLSFGEIIRLLLRNADGLTNGPQGIMNIGRPVVAGWMLQSPVHFYYFGLFWLVVLLFALDRIATSRLGAAWAAARENEQWLLSTGYNVLTVRISACVLGALFAGIGGVFFAGWQTFVAPESFVFFESILVLCMVVLGGGTHGNLLGVLIGAFLLALLPEWLRAVDEYRMMAVGAGMTAIAVFRTKGIIREPWSTHADASLFRKHSLDGQKTREPSESPSSGFQALRVTSLRKSYGGVHALGQAKQQDTANNTGFSFTFHNGNVYGIIGLNGAGKTTLFNCIRGMIVPNAGTIAIDDIELFNHPVRQRGKNRDSVGISKRRRLPAYRAAEFISSAFQTCSNLDDIPAWKNVYLALKPIGGTWAAVREIVNSVLRIHRHEHVRLKDQAIRFLVDIFDFPVAELERPVSELPFAQRRTVELAKAFVTNRPVVLLDKPTAGLEEPEQRNMIQIIRELAKGRIVIVIEHNYQLLRDFADVVMFMKDGRIGIDKKGEIVGTYDEVMSRESIHNIYLGGKHPSREAVRGRAARPTTTVLDAEIKGAGYTVGAPVLRDIRIRIAEGNITALVGPNGAGKSTLLRCLINSGELGWIDGVVRKHQNGSPITLVDSRAGGSLPTHMIAQNGVILLRQENKVFATMTVRENLEFALPLSSTSENGDGTTALQWFLETIFSRAFPDSHGGNFADILARKAGELSGGQQQLLAVGRALLASGVHGGRNANRQGGPLLLLDEPTAGLQPSLTKVVFDTVEELSEKYGLSFLIAEQSDIVENIADHVLRVENGRIVS